MLKTILFLLPVFFLPAAKAQYEEKDFVRYTVKEGLSDNYITSLQQDKQGYIWISTDIGLNRFDGYSFKKFYEGTPPLPLQSNTIRDIKLFGREQLGILSRNGLQVLNTGNFSFRNYAIADSTAFSTHLNAAWDAVQLPGHSFGITTASGFYVYTNNGTLNFRYDAYGLKDIGKKKILYGKNIFALDGNEYLVYTDETGLAYYNAEKKVFRTIKRSENEWKSFSHPATTADDHWIVKHQLSSHEFVFISYRKDSILFYDHVRKKTVASPLPLHTSIEFSWETKIVSLSDSVLAINGGTYGFYLLHINRQTGNISCDGKKIMPSWKIISMFADKDKRLWLGTNKGLLKQKLNPALISLYRYAPAPGETLTGGFTSVFRHKDKLYAGRYSLYKGLVIINAASMQPEKQIEFYGGNNGWNEILSIEMYHPDTLWLGTNAGLLWLDTKTNRYGKLLDEKKYRWAAGFVPILAPARTDGYAWMCSYLGGMVLRYHIASRTFTRFTSQTQPALPFDKVKSIAYDSYGNVWIGGHSLARWNNQQQLFDTLITVYGGANKFNDDIVNLGADANGSLWLHNAYNNLLEYRIKEKKFIAYASREGLPADELQSFSPVIDNTLWIGSNTHLMKFNTDTKKITVYNQSDGLPEYKPSGRRIYYDQVSNSLYMCSNEYLVQFPVQFISPADNSSGLIPEELMINNKSSFFQPGNDLQLKYTNNNITVNYTIIDFESANYQFAYKLNDTETWIALGEQRSMLLNNLQPGKYLIHLKATGKSGNEKYTEISFTIRPPFWKTTLFLSACAILLLSILYYLYRYRIQQIRQKANIDKLLAQTEMKALHSQMNPHFIFNSLNSIREMILNDENKQASHYLGKFAQLIRMTLDQSGQSFISLRKTLDYLHRYIEMEQIRNAHFTSRIQADAELDADETLLPPMLIQPFVENAIWHGTTGTRKNIHITIDFKKQNNLLVCTIDDDGIGIDQALRNKNGTGILHSSVGISNIKNRMKLLNEKYNLQSSITIEDKSTIAGSEEKGTKVTLQLPVEINEV
jgi:ligand-binding sensor domain-containing protein